MTLINQVREDLKKLAKLAANLSEAHTSAIFLRTGLLASGTQGLSSSETGQSEAPQSIELVALQSLSTATARDCRMQVGSGLLGWVAQHARPIHVAPFDLDSSTLGLYTEREPLKSLVAVPIPMPVEGQDPRDAAASCAGVLMCDSRKAFSFTKIQVKLLEDIALQVSRLLFWSLCKPETTGGESSWESFRFKLDQLGDAIGADSVEIIRVTVESFALIEKEHGLSAAVQQSEQFVRLAQQALPPHFPLLRLPNGEILIALDNMMGAFFQHKLRTLASHVSTASRPFSIAAMSFSARAPRTQGVDLDFILQQRPNPVRSSAKNGNTKAVGGARA
jgi:hypothetical protein